MSRLPAHHRPRGHAELLAGLSRRARQLFEGADVEGLLHAAGVTSAPSSPWDPERSRAEGLMDPAAGLLDVCAVALHVLWTYQGAWAEEVFLPTARLDASVDRLLAQIGHRPTPGLAASGWQHLRCKAGGPVRLPRGIRFQAPAEAGRLPVIFETTAPVTIHPELNSLSVLSTTPPETDEATENLEGADTGATGAGTGSSRPGSTSEDVVDDLERRLDVVRDGSASAHAIADARRQARQLGDWARMLRDNDDRVLGAGLDEACREALLEDLCSRMSEAAEAIRNARQTADQPRPGGPRGPLTEPQAILARALRGMRAQRPGAVDALARALAPCPGEAPEAHAARLDDALRFMDGLTTTLIRQARDRIVLLRGAGALRRLDRALAGDPEARRRLGRARRGTDTLFVLGPAGRHGEPTPLPMIRPGDAFGVVETIERVDPGTGETRRQRHDRQIIRVVEVEQTPPPGLARALTRITFTPPLTRGYALSRITLVGNLAPITAGETRVFTGVPGPDGHLPLSEAPLTWVADPAEPGGRRPEVELTVAGRRWTRVEDLTRAGPHEPAFVVAPVPGGGHRLEVGDGHQGAALPHAAEVQIRMRVGLGAEGNRASRALNRLMTPHPAVETTFNLTPTTGGADPEARERARQRGPAALRALDRAVSEADILALALSADGVAHARVFRDPVYTPRQVAVAVAGPGVSVPPKPVLTGLTTFLQRRVPPGVVLQVEALKPVQAAIALTASLHPWADPLTVTADIRQRLGVDDAPEPGLLHRDRLDHTLARPLDLSTIYAALEGVEGLATSHITALHRADAPPGLSDRLDLAPRELLVGFGPVHIQTTPWEDL